MFETVYSEPVFHGKVFDVRRDQVRYPDGRLLKLDVVEHGESVSIIPIDEQGQIWFVRQYRHPAGRLLLEIPAGVIDPGETPADSAMRELREEIGMTAGVLQPIGEFYLAPGYSTEYMYVYLAQDLRHDPLQADEDEMISIEKVPVQQVFSRAASGQILDAKSLATLFLVKDKLLNE
jgi:ADP-ribose pyrophosphatase